MHLKLFGNAVSHKMSSMPSCSWYG